MLLSAAESVAAAAATCNEALRRGLVGGQRGVLFVGGVGVGDNGVGVGGGGWKGKEGKRGTRVEMHMIMQSVSGVAQTGVPCPV